MEGGKNGEWEREGGGGQEGRMRRRRESGAVCGAIYE